MENEKINMDALIDPNGNSRSILGNDKADAYKPDFEKLWRPLSELPEETPYRCFILTADQQLLEALHFKDNSNEWFVTPRFHIIQAGQVLRWAHYTSLIPFNLFHPENFSSSL